MDIVRKIALTWHYAGFAPVAPVVEAVWLTPLFLPQIVLAVRWKAQNAFDHHAWRILVRRNQGPAAPLAWTPIRLIRDRHANLCSVYYPILNDFAELLPVAHNPVLRTWYIFVMTPSPSFSVLLFLKSITPDVWPALPIHSTSP